MCICESEKVWEGRRKGSRDLGETMKVIDKFEEDKPNGSLSF